MSKKAMRRAAVEAMAAKGFYWNADIGRWKKEPSFVALESLNQGIRAGLEVASKRAADVTAALTNAIIQAGREFEAKCRDGAAEDDADRSATTLSAALDKVQALMGDVQWITTLNPATMEKLTAAMAREHPGEDKFFHEHRAAEFMCALTDELHKRITARIDGKTEPAESPMQRRSRLFDELEECLEPDGATFVMPKPMMKRLMDRFAAEHRDEMVVDHEMRACCFLEEVLKDAISRIEARIGGDGQAPAAEDVAEAKRLLRSGPSLTMTAEEAARSRDAIERFRAGQGTARFQQEQEKPVPQADHVVSCVPRSQLVAVLQREAIREAQIMGFLTISDADSLRRAQVRADQMEKAAEAFPERQRVNVLDAESIEMGHVPVREFQGNATVAKGWLCDVLNALLNARGDRIPTLAEKRKRIVDMIGDGIVAGMTATPPRDYPS